MNTIEAIRIVIADDHEMTRNGLRYLFSFEPDFSLLASVPDGRELVDAVRKYEPHIVITDLKMRHMHGMQACDLIRTASPQTDIIVYSMHEGEDFVRRMRGLGVKGYLLKNGNGSEVCKAVRAVYSGGEYYTSSIREHANSLFLTGKYGKTSKERTAEFNEVELQIIQFLCLEYSTKEIAGKLKIKERTIQTYKEKIEDKMGVRGIVGIAVYAMQNWLVA